MALSKEAKSAAVKGQLAELVKMLGGMNMAKARKKKMGAMPMGEMESEGDAPDDLEDDADESAEMDMMAGGKKKRPKKMPMPAGKKGGMGGMGGMKGGHGGH